MAFKFDPSQYETVKQRKDRLAKDHPNHVFLAMPREVGAEQASFTVAVWRDRAKMEEGAQRLAEALKGSGWALIETDMALLLMCPDSVGTAYEAKWMGQASATSWTENAEESAIGRALDNLGYHGGGKCSREEILKAKEAETVLAGLRDHLATPEDPFASEDAVDLSSMPRFQAKIVEMHGKKGVRELKALVMHAVLERWTQDKLIAFAKAIGVDILEDAKAADYTKVLEQVKKARKEGGK